MPQGFGENAVDRSLMHSVRRMNALTKVLGKYENDPKGRKKMLKKMKKFANSIFQPLKDKESKENKMLKLERSKNKGGFQRKNKN